MLPVLWTRIDCIRIRIQVNKITKFISKHILEIFQSEPKPQTLGIIRKIALKNIISCENEAKIFVGQTLLFPSFYTSGSAFGIRVHCAWLSKSLRMKTTKASLSSFVGHHIHGSLIPLQWLFIFNFILNMYPVL